MNCERVRERIVSGRESSTVESHLSSCESCARFAERAGRIEEALRQHHTEATPDPAFAARVVARLPQASPTLGWAAAKLLPATAALVLVLSVWVWMRTSAPSELVASSPTDDLVAWVLTNGETDE